MAQAGNQDLTERFIQFYRNYYRSEIGTLAQRYPNEQRSLYIDYDDLFQFDRDLAEDFRTKPDQMREYAEEALRLYDLPADVSLGRAHVRIENLPENIDIRGIRVHDDHIGKLVSVQGIVRKATDVRPKVTEAAFECQRCGTMTYIPQTDGGFQEPHECQGCERQGPFRVNFDQSEFIDSQKLRIQESPEGLRGGETPQSLDVDIEDDITGLVSPGDHVTAIGVLHIEQVEQGNEKTAVFDLYMDGVTITVEDEEFEDMNITDEDRREIIELSERDDIYDAMVDSIAPAIYGFEEEKLAMILQLFSGVTKHLPDGSRIRGDLHMLLIGDPGTGKSQLLSYIRQIAPRSVYTSGKGSSSAGLCVTGDTKIHTAEGFVPIREIATEHHPDPVDSDTAAEATHEIYTYDRDVDAIELAESSHVWRMPEKPCRRIETANGRTIEASVNTPFLIRAGDETEWRDISSVETGDRIAASGGPGIRTDGGATSSPHAVQRNSSATHADLVWDEVVAAEDTGHKEVFDLTVPETHNFIGNGIVTHNTAAAVRDDFGDGQQWTLEAGALVLADKGIAAVDELDKMRCVAGETLVHLGNGRVSRIREIAREAEEDGRIESLPNGRTIRDVDLDVWTMTPDGSLTRRDVTAVHEYESPEELTKVSLESGESVTATEDHPFFVLENGTRKTKAAGELEPGDWTFVPDTLPRPASDGGVEATTGPIETYRETATALGAVLGYLSGDGNVHHDREYGSYALRFTNTEEELLADFERACRNVFDAEPVRPPSEQHDDGKETVRVNGKACVDRVLDTGMNLETYEDKAFPTAVSEGNSRMKSAFIRAMADSEGAVDETAGFVRISSASYELLMGIKSLLLEFGVTAQIGERSRDPPRQTLYTLTITSESSLDSFRRHIGFTLSRKQNSLETVCRSKSGDRTILDVVPDCGDMLYRLRTSLRLHQSECGINATTYCNFENGTANVSFLKGRPILETFEERVRTAEADSRTIGTPCSWETLKQIKNRYHVSQTELADGTAYTQQAVSRLWGKDDDLRSTVREELSTVVDEVRATDLEELAYLVRGDVKWRRIESVDSVQPAVADDQIPLLKQQLTELLGGPIETVEERANELLNDETDPSTWAELREMIERYDISQGPLATDLGVDQSTVSRWFDGTVTTDRFDDVVDVACKHIRARRGTVRSLLEEIEDRRQPKVYDLTVEGTHNFVANGTIVHNSEDRSAMHQALEQQQISVNKAGINATLKSRCSLLGAANPKYGRFDQYEPIGEQIDLEPALISRFDLIFTVTDQPDPEHDARLAEHIIKTNYAGELNTQREQLPSSEFTADQVANVTEEVAPEIDAELLRKYIAHAKRDCYPTMTDEAKDLIEEFYVNLRSKGADEDAPVPVTARKLEAMVRLAEASARVRLSDTVEREDADRATDIVESCLQDIGVDPETGQFDADVVETGTSKTQRDRIKNIKGLIADIEEEYEEGAPVDEVLDRAGEIGLDRGKAEREIEKLRTKGEVYEPKQGHLRTT